jgi:GNAT superfamily N-acetyltransferase
VTEGDRAALRRAFPTDDVAIRALFGTAFPASPKVDPRVTAWQYWNNPFAEPVAWVAEADGEIVGHYAGMPVPARFHGRDVTAAVGIDAAVAPSARGQGLFESLAKAVYADCGREGMPYTLCYPNDNSFRGFVKAGGLPVGRLRTFVWPLDPAWTAQRFRVPTAVGRAAIRVAFRRPVRDGPVVAGGSTPDDVDDLWGRDAEGTQFGIRRGAAWWRWRYEDCPDPAYEMFALRRRDTLAGCAVVLPRDAFGGAFGFIMEFLAVDPTAGRALLAAMAEQFSDRAGLALVALEGSALARLARAVGLRALPRRLEPKPLHFGVTDNMQSGEAMADHPWAVAWGDLDHM